MKFNPSFTILLLLRIKSFTQSEYGTNHTTEFAIPASPAFDLLGVNPSLVTRPSNIKDVKVDWSFRSWRLKPNLALQAQPIWELLYNRPDLTKYRTATKWMKVLSSLDLSAGTIEDDDLTRRLAIAAKINLYKSEDPLDSKELFTEIENAYLKKAMIIGSQINRMNDSLAQSSTKQVKDSLELEIDLKKDELRSAGDRMKMEVQSKVKEYINKNWNASMVDIAFGKIYAYQNDSLKNLKLQGAGTAFWLNGCLGIGKKILLSGILKYTMIADKNDVEDPMKSLFSYGFNFRFGSSKFNFFSEFLYSKTDNPIVLNTLNLNLSRTGFMSISYGGDWRLSRNVLLSYGVRTDYDQNIKFKNLIPVAGVSCMMR